MGIISLTKSNNLFWLGRYSERAFTTVNIFMRCYDAMLDKNPEAYKEFCAQLTIPDTYDSKDAFITKYLFDESDPNSVYHNLARAYDNAIVLRDEISSTSLSYIQMANNIIENAKHQPLSLLHLLEIMDYLYAFWGSIDDHVDSSEARNIIKCGRHIERLDLYIRLGHDRPAIEKAYARMEYRLHRSHCSYDENHFRIFSSAIKHGEDLKKVLYSLNNIFKD